MVKTTTQTKTVAAVALAALATLGLLSSLYYYGERVTKDMLNQELSGAPATTAIDPSQFKIRASMAGASNCDSGLVTGASAQCGLKYVSPIGSQAGTRAVINTSTGKITVTGYGEFSGQVCTNSVTLTSKSGFLEGTATCAAENKTYTAYGRIPAGSVSPQPTTPTYKTQASIIGPNACDSGLTSGTYAYCTQKHFTAFEIGAAATINTSNNSITVSGYDGSNPKKPICTKSTPMTSQGNLLKGTVTCESGGRVYRAYGEAFVPVNEKPITPPDELACQIKFESSAINQGQTTNIRLSSTGDADGKIQYSCRCIDGDCSSVKSDHGGKRPDTYQEGEVSASETISNFGPPETVVCSGKVANSAGVTANCNGTLTVKQAATTPPPTVTPTLPAKPCVVGTVRHNTDNTANDYGTYIWDCNCQLVKIDNNIMHDDREVLNKAKSMGVCLYEEIGSTTPYLCSTTQALYSSYSSCMVGCGPSGGTCSLFSGPYKCSTNGQQYSTLQSCQAVCGGGTGAVDIPSGAVDISSYSPPRFLEVGLSPGGYSHYYFKTDKEYDNIIIYLEGIDREANVDIIASNIRQPRCSDIVGQSADGGNGFWYDTSYSPSGESIEFRGTTYPAGTIFYLTACNRATDLSARIRLYWSGFTTPFAVCNQSNKTVSCNWGGYTFTAVGIQNSDCTYKIQATMSGLKNCDSGFGLLNTTYADCPSNKYISPCLKCCYSSYPRPEARIDKKTKTLTIKGINGEDGVYGGECSEVCARSISFD